MSAGVRRLRRVTRAALRRSARDVTADSAGRSALVIAPHPDDETLGCGATILRKRAAGTTVTVLVVTDGRGSHNSTSFPPDALAAERRREMTEAAERLDLSPGALRWAGLEDGAVGAAEDALTDLVVELVAELSPDEVYATCAEESHPDHAAVGRAARRAVERVGAGAPALLEYPVWLWGGWPLSRMRRLGSVLDAATRVVRRQAVRVRSGDLVGAKLHALAAHDTQLRRPRRVTPDEAWEVLPPSVLSAAADDVELFFPVTFSSADGVQRGLGDRGQSTTQS